MKRWPEDGRKRAVITAVTPEVDGGRFPIKRTVGEKVAVEADIFTDGHDALSGFLLYRRDGEPSWSEAPLRFLINDRWQGEFRVAEVGLYRYTIQAWVDHFETWRQQLLKKHEAGQDLSVELLAGADLVEAAGRQASAPDDAVLAQFVRALRNRKGGKGRIALLQEGELAAVMARYPDRRLATWYERELFVSWIGKRLASARGTRCSPAPRLLSRGSTAPSRTVKPVSPM